MACCTAALRPDGGVSDDATSLVEAARRTHAEGYHKTDAYSPFPIHELFDALDAHDRRVPLILLLGGIAGCCAGFGLCYWVSTIAYPLNVGGRPLNSWPSFIPVTFEVTILLASLTAVLSWIVLSGLPMPYHPVFNVPRFASNGQRGCIFSDDRSDGSEVRSHGTRRDFLKSLGAREINEVEPRSVGAAGPAARARREAAESRAIGGGAPRALMHRSAWLAAVCSLLCLLIVAGCRQDMHNQPKYRPLRATEFFRDGSSARPLVEGTVARGHAAGRRGLLHGQDQRAPPVTELPFAVDEHVLDRGEERYNIYCTPCHDAHRQRQWHGRAARLSPAAVVPRRPPARGGAWATFST